MQEVSGRDLSSELMPNWPWPVNVAKICLRPLFVFALYQSMLMYLPTVPCALNFIQKMFVPKLVKLFILVLGNEYMTIQTIN